MLKEKDGVLEKEVHVLIIMVHRWRNELGWSSKGTKYCRLIREVNLEKDCWSCDRSITIRSVGHSVGRSVGQPVNTVNWPVFYEKYCMYVHVLTAVKEG